jgi:hypothetical protein
MREEGRFGGLPMLEKIAQAWRSNRGWIGRDIAVPFAVTRCVLILAGWFSRYFPVNAGYPRPEAAARGWQFSPHRLLDMWGRWDSGWYMSIIFNGYTAGGELHATKSNIAFYPLYPYLVRSLLLLLPSRFRTPEVALLAGVLLSNVLLLAALVLLHKLVRSLFSDEALARRTVLYLLLFPTGFFLSCFYTESLFLFLSVAALYAASRKSWAVAAFLGGLLALTRPQGILISAPLAWVVLESAGWKPRGIRWDAAWLLLVPVSLSLFLLYGYLLTGDPIATFHVRAAWGHRFSLSWHTFSHPIHYNAFLTPIDCALTVGFFLLALASMFMLPSASYGLYALLLVSPLLFLGTFASGARYCVAAFPVLILAARLGKRPSCDLLITVLFLTLQMLLMVAWCRFYWVG